MKTAMISVIYVVYSLTFIKYCAIFSHVAAHKNKVVQGLQGGHRL